MSFPSKVHDYYRNNYSKKEAGGFLWEKVKARIVIPSEYNDYEEKEEYWFFFKRFTGARDGEDSFEVMAWFDTKEEAMAHAKLLQKKLKIAIKELKKGKIKTEILD